MRAMPKLSKDIKKRIEIEVSMRVAEAQKELDEKVESIRKEEREYTLRRFLKAACCVLHDIEDYDAEDCERFIKEYFKFFDENQDDDYLWEHIDGLVMDRMGLLDGWERDYSDE
jgi:hypothetical protein